MSKYEVEYACGHSGIVDLFGKESDRKRRLEYFALGVCRDCWKVQKSEEDLVADKLAKLFLVPGGSPGLAIEISGQIEANKQSLYALGYTWKNSSEGGAMSVFSIKKSKKVLAVVCEIQSLEQMSAWYKNEQNLLEELGYKLEIHLTEIDNAWIMETLKKLSAATIAKTAAKAKLDEIIAIDPMPEDSNLRKNIREIENNFNAKWNKKIYGKKGDFNFYVNNIKYQAEDIDVAEHEEQIKKIKEWKEKYNEIISSAK